MTRIAGMLVLPKALDAESARIIGDALLQLTRERDEARAMTPAWHARPTSPGWWVASDKNGYRCSLKLDANDLKWPENYFDVFYGPIPEPPEPTP